MSPIDKMIDKDLGFKLHCHIDLTSLIILGIVIGILGAVNNNTGICGIGALTAFGRKGLDVAKEIAIIYADKNKIG